MRKLETSSVCYQPIARCCECGERAALHKDALCNPCHRARTAVHAQEFARDDDIAMDVYKALDQIETHEEDHLL